MQFVDSHCHLNLMTLTDFQGCLHKVIEAASAKGVSHMLCASVSLEQYEALCDLARQHDMISISVGVHPDQVSAVEPTPETLAALTDAKGCVAIGETGLDYYHAPTPEARALQETRFRHHIQAARLSKRPLIIHTRQAAEATLACLKTENAQEVGGVMHCFTETWEVAKAAMDLGFYISFSGIITFKNALALQEVAKKIPLDRLLIETDAPFLAPTPFRSQQNQPAFVTYVAAGLAALRQTSVETIAAATTENFFQCFGRARPAQPTPL